MKFVTLTLLLASVCQPVFSQMDLAGSGRAIYFDGADDYVDFGDILDDLDLPFTVSAWINVDLNKQGHSPIFVSQDNNSLYNGFWLIINATNLFVGYGDGRGYNNPVFRREKTARHGGVHGKWTHVCAVVRGAVDMDLYVNGINIAGDYTGSTSYPMVSNYPDEIAKAGFWVTNDVTHSFKGYIDDIRLWDRALDQSQVRDEMCRKIEGSAPGLIAYWNFDETSGNAVFDQGPLQLHGSLKNSAQRTYSGAPIGDVSIQHYGSIQNAVLDLVEVEVLSGSPAGVHLYKVLHPPSQTSGILPAEIPDSYYGAFFVNTTGKTNFEVKDCVTHHRHDNSVPMWVPGYVSPFEDRVEVILRQASALMLDLGPDQTVCTADHLSLLPEYQNAIQFVWNTGQTTPNISVTSSGFYKLTISNGCQHLSDSVEIVFGEPLLPIDLGEDQVFCPGQVVNLSADLDPEGKSFLWSNGSTSPSIQTRQPGLYQLIVSNECGSVEGSVRLMDAPANTSEDFPNVFTPNGDGFNQNFVVSEANAGPISIQIFNRWGREIYGSSEYTGEWDGSNVSPGVYFYVLRDECGRLIKGSVSILH